MEAKQRNGLIVAASLIVAALACGARLIAGRGRKPRTSSALDRNMPNYAWLR